VRVNTISLALQYLLDGSALHRERAEADARYEPARRRVYGLAAQRCLQARVG
jgi:hypothetical protein